VVVKNNIGFGVNVEQATIKNDNYRKVIFTGPHAQLVLMALKPGEDIGAEVHPNLDQFIRIDEGSGKAIIAGKTYQLVNGSAIVVPAGSRHNVIAGDKGIKLYTVYTSKEHPDMIVERTKAEAKQREGSEKNKHGSKEEDMKKSSVALVIVPGSLMKSAKLSNISAKHPAGISKVEGASNMWPSVASHTERIKLAQMAAERMLPKANPEKVTPPTVDHKGREVGGKAPSKSFDTSVSGMGSSSSDLFGKPSNIKISSPVSLKAGTIKKK
jgi:mannose-6-phosphate isomerase-like protein (cupin superfamily)